MAIRDNLELVNERIDRAAVKAGRDPSGITVIAVTKTHGPRVVIEAIEAGIRDIGENRIQEFLEKADAVDIQCRWHLVGHLQTNKVNKAIGRFALIQSVDSLRLAGRLSAASERGNLVTNILLEVNTSGEESKYGFRPEETVEAYERISGLPGLSLNGLMTIGPWVDDTAVVSASFAVLRRLGEEVERCIAGSISLEHLSMGMTDDFEIAIAEGSTMVRLGRVLFGERSRR